MNYFGLFIRRGWQTAILFLCLLFIFGTKPRGRVSPGPVPLPVYISTAFENASPLQWSVDSVGQVDIALLYDHERFSVNRSNGHWLFQVQAKKGMDLVLVLRNFDNYWNGHLAAAITDRTPACISVDGRHWTSIPATRLPGNRLRIALRMPADTVYVSETEPYRISDLERFEQGIEADPLVHISIIGHTVEGRPLEMIRVGDSLAPHRVLIRARAHGYEAGGNWVVEGLVRRLLTKDSRKMLRRF